MAENVLEWMFPTLKETYVNWIKSTLNTTEDLACRELPQGPLLERRGYGTILSFPSSWDYTTNASKANREEAVFVQCFSPRDRAPDQPWGKRLCPQGQGAGLLPCWFG